MQLTAEETLELLADPTPGKYQIPNMTLVIDDCGLWAEVRKRRGRKMYQMALTSDEVLAVAMGESVLVYTISTNNFNVMDRAEWLRKALEQKRR